MSRPLPTGQPAILPMAPPKPGRNPANDKPLADGRPRTVPTDYPSVPPWQYSNLLGGEYIYNPETDEVALKTGQRFARPQHVSVQSLLPASWVGTLPFQYDGSPPNGQPSRPLPTNSTASRYSGSPLTGYPSEPQWHYNPSLGGEFYYNPRIDEVVVMDGRRFLRPPHVPGHTLPFAAWDDPNRDPYPTFGGSDPHLLGGSREQTESTGRSRPRSMDPATGMRTQGPMPRTEPTVVLPRGKAQEMRTQITSSGGQIPPPKKLVPASLPELVPEYKIRDKRFFRIGRVFLILWSEPAGGNPSETRPSLLSDSLNHLGERVFSKIRRFVVIREGERYCSCLPINTYGGRGVAKRGVTKAEHAIIYTGRTQPRVRTDEAPGREESGMQPIPIRVDPDNPTDQLDPMSRIHFGGVTTVQHNIKVKAFGLVNSASMDDLQHQFRKVWGLSTDNAVERDGNSRDSRQGKDCGTNYDSEEEDDDDEGGEEGDEPEDDFSD